MEKAASHADIGQMSVDCTPNRLLEICHHLFNLGLSWERFKQL
jgi:hypothetical protein